MAIGYMDRRGAEITRDEWKQLHADPKACLVKDDEIETENIGVKTEWFGIGPDAKSPDLIFTTSVYILDDVRGMFKPDFSVSNVMESVHVRTEEEARIVHEDLVVRVYRGAYRMVLSTALSCLEVKVEDDDLYEEV